MKKFLLLSIALLSVLFLTFTGCKKKETTSFPNGTTWSYSIPNTDPNTAIVAPSIGIVTLKFTDQVSGTVDIKLPAPKSTPIPATSYSYVDATGTLIITGIDLSGFLGEAATAIPLKGTFNSEHTELTISLPGMGSIVFTKE